MEHLAKMDAKAVEAAEESLKSNGEFNLELNGSSYRLTPDMVQVKRCQETLHVEEFVPNVIEPSFGIGRIMYAIFEHNFRVRSDDDQKTVIYFFQRSLAFYVLKFSWNFCFCFCFQFYYFSLPSIIAPLKCSVLPLSSKPEFTPFVRQLCEFISHCENIKQKLRMLILPSSWFGSIRCISHGWWCKRLHWTTLRPGGWNCYSVRHHHRFWLFKRTS